MMGLRLVRSSTTMAAPSVAAPTTRHAIARAWLQSCSPNVKPVTRSARPATRSASPRKSNEESSSAALGGVCGFNLR